VGDFPIIRTRGESRLASLVRTRFGPRSVG
jgi:hypothetical protein